MPTFHPFIQMNVTIGFRPIDPIACSYQQRDSLRTIGGLYFVRGQTDVFTRFHSVPVELSPILGRSIASPHTPFVMCNSNHSISESAQ